MQSVSPCFFAPFFHGLLPKRDFRLTLGISSIDGFHAAPDFAHDPELPELQKNLPLEDFAGFYMGKPIQGHMHNFVTCMKEGGETVSDVDSTVQMMNVCHLLGIAARLGRDVVWDPKTETTGDEQSRAFLSREQRKGYENPVVA